MSNFFHEQLKVTPPPSETLVDAPRPILKNPIEVDLTHPDRSKSLLAETTTHPRSSKVVAEIQTPTETLDVILTPFGDFSIVSLVGDDLDAFIMIEQGETKDISGDDEHGDGKCIVTFDKTGQNLFVYATNVDPDYRIFTKGDRQAHPYDAPLFEDTVDDPELPYTISRS